MDSWCILTLLPLEVTWKSNYQTILYTDIYFLNIVQHTDETRPFVLSWIVECTA